MGNHAYNAYIPLFGENDLDDQSNQYHSNNQDHTNQPVYGETAQRMNPYQAYLERRHQGYPLIPQTPQAAHSIELGYAYAHRTHYEDNLDLVSSTSSNSTDTYVDVVQQTPPGDRKKKRRVSRKPPPPETPETPEYTPQTNLEPPVDPESGCRNEKRMFSFLFSKKVPHVPTENERKLYPWHISNYFKQTGFWWLWPILKTGYKRTLTGNDMYHLTPEIKVASMHKVFQEHLDRILNDAYEKHIKKGLPESEFKWPTLALPWACFLTFKWQYTWSCLYLMLGFIIAALSPLVSRKIIQFVEYRSFGIERTVNKGVGYVICAMVLTLLNTIFINHFFHLAMMTGAQIKAILTKAIIMKSFKLSSKSRYMFPHGRIASLILTDLARIDLAVGFQPLVVCFPVSVIISITLLMVYFGVPALAGIGLFILSLIVCVWLTKILYDTRETVVKFTDQRISLMREVLENLKVIKFYAWELAYKMNIISVREQEMNYLFKIKVLRNFITAYAVTLPSLTSMVSYITMWASNRTRSPADVFSSLSLFAILAQSIMLLPIALSSGADAYIGFNRCGDYLSSEEFVDTPNKYGKDNEMSEKTNYGLVKTTSVASHDSSSSEASKEYAEKPYYGNSDIVLLVRNANFVWETFHDDLDESLWDISKETRDARKAEKKARRERLKMMKKEKHAINSYANSVGNGSLDSLDSGESASDLLFPGLLNVNFDIKRGEFIIVTGIIGSGKSSLLSAMAGFMKLSNPGTGSLQVNEELIFCSSPWIQNATVRENILFGRPYDPEWYQKVIYACALDDDINLLPAGDRTEIGERGITLSGGQKARINLARAVYSDALIYLFDDVISAVDARVGKHIVQNLFRGLLYGKTVILATHQLGFVLSADRVAFLTGDGSVDIGTTPELLSRNVNFERLLAYTQDHEDDEVVSKDESNYNSNTIEKPSMSAPTAEGTLEGRTIQDEEMATNAISWKVYKNFIDLGAGVFGLSATPLFVLTVCIATFCQLFANTWLSYWMEKKFPGRSDKFYVSIYVMFNILTVIWTALEFTMLAYMNNLSAEKLNVNAVNKILHAPMSFMDTNPLGRVLNRFTKDTDSLDNELGEQLRLFIFPMALIIGIFILCICYLPWFAITVPFFLFAFIFLSTFYQGSAREIKRLESTLRSLVYNNLNEVLSGMATIQAFKAERDFVDKNDRLIDKMNEAYYLSIVTQRWLCFHLDLIAAAFALVICLLCITGQFNIGPSPTGLLLNYVLQIVGLLSFTVRSMTQVENEMNSAERLYEYSFELPQEAAYKKPEFTPAPEWPPAGYIQFQNVGLRYRKGLPLVLKDLNLNIYPGEKVGICGRTGAGKSSIMTALYRLTELEQGNIIIDGLNIADMGLYDLRSRLSIIPQDPVLFQGSIRKNLDPFGEYSDDLLWDTLRRSGLIDSGVLFKVRSTKYDPKNNVGYEDLHKFHLDQVVEDAGANFSLGERQLIALARSLIRNSKILILDEATSSVDFETDSKIQETIASEFNRCTILCIAHRLKTILKYDRIVVMDQGTIAEKGNPWTLYEMGGVFRNMCDKAKITPEDF